MKLLRFIFPFLFIRNWHTGAWEISKVRLVLTGIGLALFILGIIIALILQAPVEYYADNEI